MFEKLQQALSYVRTKTQLQPSVGIVLGTGLGKLADKIEPIVTIPYHEIPFMPRTTVDSHRGNLIIGQIDKITVVALQGRFHYYEGYSFQEITYPVRLFKFLGVQTIVISNAAGGLNSSFRPGDIMMVKDHINLMSGNPLRGINDPRFGDRFPDMLNTYDKEILELAKHMARDLNIDLKMGVYAAVQGPSLETHAEHKFLKVIGADVVGMSTVPEVIVAKQMGMRIVVFSIVTNQCLPYEQLKETTLEDVIAAAQSAEPRLTQLIFSLVKNL